MNLKVQAIYKQTVQSLCEIYDENEAASISFLLFSELLSIDKMSRLTNPNLTLSSDQLKIYQAALKRLLQKEPLQHITGKTHFYGFDFFVSKNTLIPRPETEELVDLIIKENTEAHLKILDIGTGSGCIPISLALYLQNASVTSIDISDDALTIAQQNAHTLDATVQFRKLDILNEDWPSSELDIVVSNPPYIPMGEKAAMDKNVVDYEPELALFVPDHDPLLFYRAISEGAIKHLRTKGKLYFEIHHAFGKETVLLLERIGFTEVRLLQDLQGKDRFVIGKRP